MGGQEWLWSLSPWDSLHWGLARLEEASWPGGDDTRSVGRLLWATGSGALVGSADVPKGGLQAPRVGEQPQSPLLWASLHSELRLTAGTTWARVHWETALLSLDDGGWKAVFSRRGLAAGKRRGPSRPWWALVPPGTSSSGPRVGLPGSAW